MELDDQETFVIKNEGGTDDYADVEDHHHEVVDLVPPGFRFCPRDDELVVHYLKKKVLGEPLPMNKILEANLYKFDPDTVSATYEGTGEGEWYFFTPRDRKYPNGDRPNRAAGNGYWKATGADKKMVVKNVAVGLRKALVYYYGKPPKGVKSNWIMHEYKLADSSVQSTRTQRTDKSDMRLDDYILCRIYRKSERARNFRYTGYDEEARDLLRQEDSPTAAATSPSTSSLIINPTDQTPSFHHHPPPPPPQQQLPTALPWQYNNALGVPSNNPLEQQSITYMNNYVNDHYEDLGRDWSALDLDSLARCFNGDNEYVPPLPVDDGMDYGIIDPNSFNL